MYDLAKQIKAYRTKKNVTQEQLAAYLNISRQTISKWESGKSTPDIENAKLMANYFEIDLNELLDFTIDKQDVKNKNGKKKIKKYTLISSAILLSFLILTSLIIYHQYYSDPHKDIMLYGIKDLVRTDSNELYLETSKNKKIPIDSYSDIVWYSITHKRTEDKFNVVQKKQIDNLLAGKRFYE